MIRRDLFEQEFEVPAGVHWSDAEQIYICSRMDEQYIHAHLSFLMAASAWEKAMSCITEIAKEMIQERIVDVFEEMLNEIESSECEHGK